MKKVRDGKRRQPTRAEKADIEAARAIALDRGSASEPALSALRRVGDQPPMAAASVTMLACGLVFRDRRMARAGVRMLAALGLATLLKSAIKNNVDRTRPGEVIENGGYRLAPGGSKAKALRSMPSGHSAGASAVFRAAARDYPSMSAPLMGAAGAIAAAQLPTRNHFITDIAAGAALGFLSEWIASQAVDKADQALGRRIT